MEQAQEQKQQQEQQQGEQEQQVVVRKDNQTGVAIAIVGVLFVFSLFGFVIIALVVNYYAQPEDEGLGALETPEANGNEANEANEANQGEGGNLLDASDQDQVFPEFATKEKFSVFVSSRSRETRSVLRTPPFFVPPLIAHLTCPLGRILRVDRFEFGDSGEKRHNELGQEEEQEPITFRVFLYSLSQLTGFSQAKQRSRQFSAYAWMQHHKKILVGRQIKIFGILNRGRVDERESERESERSAKTQGNTEQEREREREGEGENKRERGEEKKEQKKDQKNQKNQNKLKHSARFCLEAKAVGFPSDCSDFSEQEQQVAQLLLSPIWCTPRSFFAEEVLTSEQETKIWGGAHFQMHGVELLIY